MCVCVCVCVCNFNTALPRKERSNVKNRKYMKQGRSLSFRNVELDDSLN